MQAVGNTQVCRHACHSYLSATDNGEPAAGSPLTDGKRVSTQGNCSLQRWHKLPNSCVHTRSCGALKHAKGPTIKTNSSISVEMLRPFGQNNANKSDSLVLAPGGNPMRVYITNVANTVHVSHTTPRTHPLLPVQSRSLA